MSAAFEHRVECVSCGKRLKYSDAQIGQRGRCPRCHNPVLLPDPKAQAAAEMHSWPPGFQPPAARQDAVASSGDESASG